MSVTCPRLQELMLVVFFTYFVSFIIFEQVPLYFCLLRLLIALLASLYAVFLRTCLCFWVCFTTQFTSAYTIGVISFALSRCIYGVLADLEQVIVSIRLFSQDYCILT